MQDFVDDGSQTSEIFDENVAIVIGYNALKLWLVDLVSDADTDDFNASLF